jgi:hypothetical protein
MFAQGSTGSHGPQGFVKQGPRSQPWWRRLDELIDGSCAGLVPLDRTCESGMRSCSYARASSNGQRSNGGSERRVRCFMRRRRRRRRRRKMKMVVRLGSLGMSNRAFPVGLRHAELPTDFSAFSLAARLELVVTRPTRLLVQEPRNVSETTCRSNNSFVTSTRGGDDVDQGEKERENHRLHSLRSSRKISQLQSNRCSLAEQERSRSNYLEARATAPISLVACSKSFVFSCRRIYCAILSLHGILIEAHEALRRFNGVPQKASIQRPANPEIPP